MIKSLILCIMLGISAAVWAPPQRHTKLSPHRKTVRIDSSHLIPRSFNADAMRGYRAGRDFNYKEGFQGRSWWSRFWGWFWEKVFKLLPRGRTSAPFFKFLVISIFAGTLIYAILKYTGLDFAGLFRKKKSALTVPYAESSDNIHEISFDLEIEKAMASRNYRLAVRLLYLRTLKMLNEGKLISWQPAKTNRTYIDELADIEKKGAFQKLTQQFEYVWYGDFQINNQGFEQIRASFANFNERLG